ncbi:MAG: TetR/AcrR family transcriptional regulator [Myxococcota bacterium]|nr:TetR/AcrR family transcriptional regulator [Myxococcota bacterium]
MPPSPEIAPTPPRRRGQETSEHILDAAEACFARKGYAGTTLRNVADVVGIRIPSLYNHFANKEALYAAVLERGMGPVLSVLSASMEDGSGDYPEPNSLIREMMMLLGDRPNLPRLVQYELLAGGHHLAPLLENWLRPAIAQSMKILKSTPAVRRWGPDQMPYLLVTFFNIVVGHFTTASLTESLMGNNPLSAEGLAESSKFYGELFASLIEAED